MIGSCSFARANTGEVWTARLSSPERNASGPVAPNAVIHLHRALEVLNDHVVSLCSWHSL
jgi:hypothetical protein